MDNNFKKMGVTCYCVGEKYDKIMQRDGAVFETYHNRCYCSIGLTDVSAMEIQAVEEGCIVVNLCEIYGIIFVCVNIGNILSFNMLFNMCLYKNFALKKPEDSGGYIMPIILVENRTNIIKAMRVICLDAAFSKKLYALSKKQWENGLKNYDKRLKKALLKYQTKALIDKSIVCNIFPGNIYRSNMQEVYKY